jgi:hypothetical protein
MNVKCFQDVYPKDNAIQNKEFIEFLKQDNVSIRIRKIDIHNRTYAATVFYDDIQVLPNNAIKPANRFSDLEMI